MFQAMQFVAIYVQLTGNWVVEESPSLVIARKVEMNSFFEDERHTLLFRSCHAAVIAIGRFKVSACWNFMSWYLPQTGSAS